MCGLTASTPHTFLVDLPRLLLSASLRGTSRVPFHHCVRIQACELIRPCPGDAFLPPLAPFRFRATDLDDELSRPGQSKAYSQSLLRFSPTLPSRMPSEAYLHVSGQAMGRPKRAPNRPGAPSGRSRTPLPVRDYRQGTVSLGLVLLTSVVRPKMVVASLRR
jgi:hypothetical protein